MRLSQYFLPIIKEIPLEAKLISHILMLRSSLIYKSSSGIYSWLPLGRRVLNKIEGFLRKEHDSLFANEILLPTIQPASLWRLSNRYNVYGQEMLKIKDRYNREMLYAPTAEEAMIDVVKLNFCNYKDLPKILYQIHWKFRDEIRPRFGVMRCREFFMKDAYSFDTSSKNLNKTYALMYKFYLNIFLKIKLPVIAVYANNGPIGGDISHEFHVIAKNGESTIFYDKRLEYLIKKKDIDLKQLNNHYSVIKNIHNPIQSSILQKYLKKTQGIEVGHIFSLGTKYSKYMGLLIPGKDGRYIVPHMGCFGVGISRLVAAIVELHHDKSGIIWPEIISPFKVGIINLRTDNKNCINTCEYIYTVLQNQGIDSLYDDRNERAGIKFSTMDLIGLPWQLIISPDGLKGSIIELKNRKTGKRYRLNLESAIMNFTKF